MQIKIYGKAGINYPSGKDDRIKFEKNNRAIALNALLVLMLKK